VALQLDVLLNSASISEIRKALNALPTSLDSFYDRILMEINEHDKHRAYVALQWLAFSARPLSLSELAEAIIIQPREDPCLNADERLLDENRLLEILPAGLIRKILREQPFEDGRQISRVHKVAYVEFAHFSVLEYLKSTRMALELRSSYHIEGTKAHSMIAESCLAYLLNIGRMEQALAERISKLLQKASNEDILSEWMHMQEFWTALDDGYALAAYTTRAWQFHMSRLGQVENEYLNTLALEFLSDTSNSWIIWRFFIFEESTLLCDRGIVSYAYRDDSIEFAQVEPKIHPVTWISFLGLSTLLKLLLNQSPYLSNIERTPYFGGPLHAAATVGNLQVVQILLSALEDPNEHGGYYRTPLVAASSRRCPQVAQLLLESGADVNTGFKDNKTPLIAASDAGSAEVVKLLLDSGADINARDGYKTALIGASKRGYLEVVKLLLESGADTNARGGYKTALIEASKGGHLEVVKLLLESGADVNTQVGYTTALIEASNGGHLEVVKLLLESGADVNANANNGHETLLVAASERVRRVYHSRREAAIQLVKLLLDAGADRNGYSPQYMITESGRLEW
jgi:ankyrin repeat protein